MVWIRPFDLRVSVYRGPAMDYISTDFGADGSSRFRLERGQTDRQTRLNTLPHAGGYTCTAGVGNNGELASLDN